MTNIATNVKVEGGDKTALEPSKNDIRDYIFSLNEHEQREALSRIKDLLLDIKNKIGSCN